MEITAAVARAPKSQLTIERLELDPPRSNEILVKLTAVGICHTDIAMRDQAFPVPQPIVLGHEGSGVVAAVGSGVSKVKPGDHVVMSFNSCGSCESCLENKPSYWGSKPEPPKIPSPQFQLRHERVQVYHLAVTLEGVVSVQQDVPPRRRRALDIGSRRGRKLESVPQAILDEVLAKAVTLFE